MRGMRGKPAPCNRGRVTRRTHVSAGTRSHTAKQSSPVVHCPHVHHGHDDGVEGNNLHHGTNNEHRDVQVQRSKQHWQRQTRQEVEVVTPGNRHAMNMTAILLCTPPIVLELMRNHRHPYMNERTVNTTVFCRTTTHISAIVSVKELEDDNNSVCSPYGQIVR